MSAFLVGKPHIDALVEAAIRYRALGPLTWYDRDMDTAWEETGGDWEAYRRLGNAHRHEATFDRADYIGRMLWQENYRSVAARYPNDGDGELPGQERESAAMTEYCYQRPARPLSAVAALKAMACYRYQSCEHDGWKTSEAAHFTDALEHRLITEIPGYEDAAWEVA